MQAEEPDLSVQGSFISGKKTDEDTGMSSISAFKITLNPPLFDD